MNDGPNLISGQYKLPERFVPGLKHVICVLSGSPSRVSHSSSESLSISSRFLSQNSAGSRTVAPLPSRGGGAEVKARPLVSEVRPLMEQNQNQTQDRRVSWNHDSTQKQNQDRFQSQNRLDQDQTQPPQQGTAELEEEETSSAQQAHRPSLLKKVQTGSESRRNLGPTARAAASHLNSSSGLRKAQSVQSLLTDTGTQETQVTPNRRLSTQTKIFSSRPSGDSSHPTRDVPSQMLLSPQMPLPLQRPTTLPSSPRRPPSTAPPLQRPSPASPRSPQQEAVTPRKSSSSSSSTASAPRSYMSPTASSMAKMSRSVSVGDGLNISEPSEGPSVTSSSSMAATITASSQVSGSSPDDSAPDQRQMAVVLSEAFRAMRAELDCLPLSTPSILGVEGGLGGVGEVKTAALLEEYSLLLLQAVHRRVSERNTE
ncbi:hypothetical protein GBF38_021230 [Nibea albiflora]|uniref:Uncharacterized protein n=1 Tax=Nibea albiflora TaxID=240163 RepID=A0ACB7FFU0_NIBAL|nr:hypothetical protein GBF38_021230 [Nibea albiflora]